MIKSSLGNRTLLSRAALSSPVSAAPEFSDLQWYAGELGVPSENLIRVFDMEQRFHKAILTTREPALRRTMYAELYAAVHPLLTPAVRAPGRHGYHERLVKLFRRELTGKSVLDVGCGEGTFLKALHRLLPHGELLGLDTSSARVPDAHSAIQFQQADITSFRLDAKVDVVFSCQVLEHIAPADIRSHLQSVRAALVDGGLFISVLPNRLWGPYDVTRVIDNSFRGRVAAQGSHLNESTYTELIPILESQGFEDMKTVVPFAGRLPLLKRIRLRPWFNLHLERHALLRTAVQGLRWRRKPIYQNPILLLARKSRVSPIDTAGGEVTSGPGNAAFGKQNPPAHRCHV